MPTEDVSDLRDVVEAINKLCETMKSSYDETEYEDCTEVVDSFEPVNPSLIVDVSLSYVSETLESGSTVPTENFDSGSNSTDDLDIRWYNPIYLDSELKDSKEDLDSVWPIQVENLNIPWSTETENLDSRWSNTEELIDATKTKDSQLVNPADVVVRKIETHVAERWSDPIAEDAETIVSETENMIAHCEPISEMYYTASSGVSLLSETDMIDKFQGDDSDKEKDDRQSVMAGHVAAMRERFESMTRANTPCPDLIRSLSPSLDVFRNITPSPDFLDRS